MDSKTLFTKMYPKTEDKIGLGVSTVTTIGVLVGALRSAYKGDYDKATFKALVWLGFTTNANHQFTHRYNEVIRKHS